MTKISICPHCGEERNSRGLQHHINRTHLGMTQYFSGNHGKYDIITNRVNEKRILGEGKYLKNPRLCLHCQTILPYEPNIKRQTKFCGHSCSASYTNKTKSPPSAEQRRKTAEKLLDRHNKQYIEPTVVIVTCKECSTIFECEVTNTKKARIFCSHSCGTKYSSKLRWEQIKLTKTEFQNYRRDCQFRFNLKDYPDKFDFSLIEKYGWYKAKNRGDNLNGISRDHMISVKYGFINKIDPSIISHPANCKLVRHNDNVSKHSKCSITFEELEQRIEVWSQSGSN